MTIRTTNNLNPNEVMVINRGRVMIQHSDGSMYEVDLGTLNIGAGLKPWEQRVKWTSHAPVPVKVEAQPETGEQLNLWEDE